jgi:hypothetical protein
MNAAETIEVAELVQRVRSWPAPMRIHLARQILETLDAQPAPVQSAPQPRGASAAEIAVMFNSDLPAPDDATVKQWIDDYRVERQGK